MRRAALIILLVLSCAVTACTPNEVKAWFWINRHEHITDAQAHRIAALTNRPPAQACDPNYTGACVPTGVPDVDCAGGSGDGPAYVSGPVQVIGIDIYDLDRDGDGVGCE